MGSEESGGSVSDLQGDHPQSVGLRESMRKLFLQESTEECLMCGGQLTCGGEKSLSAEEVGLVLRALLAPLLREDHVGRMCLCGECRTSLATLADLFAQLEKLRRKFNDLRRKVGRQVIVECLGKSEETWRAWEWDVKVVEGTFPSCVGVTHEEEQLEEEEEVEVGVKEERMEMEEWEWVEEEEEVIEMKEETMEEWVEEEEEDEESDSGLDYFVSGPLGGKATEEDDLKLKQMTPKIHLLRVDEKTKDGEESSSLSESSTRKRPPSDLSEATEDENITKKGQVISNKSEDTDESVPTPPKKKRPCRTNSSSVAPPKDPQPSEPLTCPHCYREFKTASAMERHVWRFHELQATVEGVARPTQNELPCPSCLKTFVSSKGLLSHRIAFHNFVRPPKDKKEVHCIPCDLLFDTHDQLRRHQRRVHTPKLSSAPVPCSHCDVTFSDPNCLQTHLLRRHFVSSAENSVGCEFCLKMFPSGGVALKEHQKKVHLIPKGQKGGGYSPQKIFCFVCPKKETFSSAAELAAHATSSAHEERIRAKVSVHCNSCRLNFGGDVEALQVHLRSPSHLNEVKSLEKFNKSTFCVPCRTNFDDRTTHNKSFAHEKACRFRENVAPPEKPFDVPQKCGACAKIFKLRSCLERHVKTFHKAQGYTCEFCGASFSLNGDFHRHRRKSHAHEIPKNVICDKCGKTFEHLWNLIHHVRLVHEGGCAVCELCGKTCKTPLSLKSHTHNVHRLKSSSLKGQIVEKHGGKEEESPTKTRRRRKK